MSPAVVFYREVGSIALGCAVTGDNGVEKGFCFSKRLKQLLDNLLLLLQTFIQHLLFSVIIITSLYVAIDGHESLYPKSRKVFAAGAKS